MATSKAGSHERPDSGTAAAAEALGAQWAQWWMTAMPWALIGGTPAKPRPAAGTREMPLPAMVASALIDPRVLASLNAKFQPRWRALWAAASAAAEPGTGNATPVASIVEPQPGDRRFHSPLWNELPYFSLVKQGYLLAAEYLTELAAQASLPDADRKRLAFATRQYLDAVCPANFPATNPDVLKTAADTRGQSLVQGLGNLVGDARKGRISMSDESQFEVGRNLAVTPGSVVFRNELIELIQYAPTTTRVHKRPLLLVPPCINKYYILDLQQENSFVRWTVAQGHTVFLISWRNVPAELGKLTWDDYLEQGTLPAIAAVKEIAKSATLNVLGFCVGGTLLASTLAVLAARGDRSVESTTLLTTMLDFADPGEIGVYISREAHEAREPMLMGGQRVQGSELASAFSSLRANDLVWNYVVNNYLKGQTPPAFDLLFWNGDSANLPGPMYAYYLRNMYLDNRLREAGALTMLGEKVDLSAVTMPAYIYASRDDHIVPWRSAYRTNDLLGGDTTFVMGASGHIAGVINPPEKVRRNYWTNDLVADDPEAWLERAESHPGSWWPHWGQWLARFGGARRLAPATAGSARHPVLDAAPGRYVRAPAGPA